MSTPTHRVVLLCTGVAVLTLGASNPENQTIHHFSTRDCAIDLIVEALPSYLARPLVFYSNIHPNQRLCYSAEGLVTDSCMKRFVGAVTLVHFSVTPVRRAAQCASIRESVATVAQYRGLPARPPFTMGQVLVEGVATDIKVFGYDEALLKPGGRKQVRQQARATWWRICRQELYLGDNAPFAIVIWKCTLDRISILRVDSLSTRDP
jgi:hypothetical protein